MFYVPQPIPLLLKVVPVDLVGPMGRVVVNDDSTVSTREAPPYFSNTKRVYFLTQSTIYSHGSFSEPILLIPHFVGSTIHLPAVAEKAKYTLRRSMPIKRTSGISLQAKPNIYLVTVT